jgi:hypothetical protein
MGVELTGRRRDDYIGFVSTTNRVQALGLAMTFAVLPALLGAFFLFFSWQSSTGRIPRNATYGLRTAATMCSDEACAVAQRASAPGSAAGGLLLLLAGLGATAIAFRKVRFTMVSVATAVALALAGFGAFAYGGVRGQHAAVVFNAAPNAPNCST